jgi:TRAP-type mannitol/chloroaromatic compound transport system permease large subunit
MVFVALCALALDAFEIVFVVVPIVMPPLLQVTPNATWVAVLTLLVLQLSYMLPPLGMAQLLARGLGQGRADSVASSNKYIAITQLAWLRVLLPYVAVQLMVIGLVCGYPQLVTPSATTTSLQSASTPNASDAQPQRKLSDDEVMKAMQSQGGRDK